MKDAVRNRLIVLCLEVGFGLWILKCHMENKNIMVFMGFAIVTMMMVSFGAGAYALHLKKSVIGICNLKKKPVFFRKYICLILQFSPMMLLLLWIGYQYRCLLVIWFILSYQVLNTLLISWNISRIKFIVVFIIMMTCSMCLFVQYQERFW